MTESMLERVARGIAGENGSVENWRHYLPDAKACLESLIDSAGDLAAITFADGDLDLGYAEDFIAMIKAALSSAGE